MRYQGKFPDCSPSVHSDLNPQAEEGIRTPDPLFTSGSEVSFRVRHLTTRTPDSPVLLSFIRFFLGRRDDLEGLAFGESVPRLFPDGRQLETDLRKVSEFRPSRWRPFMDDGFHQRPPTPHGQ